MYLCGSKKPLIVIFFEKALAYVVKPVKLPCIWDLAKTTPLHSISFPQNLCIYVVQKILVFPDTKKVNTHLVKTDK
jgi:hypothetical protein